jgi:hypothetical protein
MKTFTYSRTQPTSTAAVIDEKELETVYPVLSSLTTKTEAITYLHNRGWGTSAIRSIIRYDDGKELLPQHVNQVRAKARAAAAAAAAAAAPKGWDVVETSVEEPQEPSEHDLAAE